MPVSLSDAKVRNAKPKEKPYKMADGEGLFLMVMPTGSKYWRLKYFFDGKEKVLALGVYPEKSLTEAREGRAVAKKSLAAGKDPGQAKKEARRQSRINSLNTFEIVAREWFENREHEWAPGSIRTKRIHLESHLLPKVGDRPIAEITSPELLEMARGIEGRGTLAVQRII